MVGSTYGPAAAAARPARPAAIADRLIAAAAPVSRCSPVAGTADADAASADPIATEHECEERFRMISANSSMGSLRATATHSVVLLEDHDMPSTRMPESS